jgi:nitrite reductase/ring-hydroxylating ferredoxin subunit
MAEFFKVAMVSEIPEGTGREVMANGRRVALFNVAGAFHAMEGVCPHQGGPLGEGILDGSVVSCPWHFWQFDVVTGHPPDFPEATLPKFRVKIEAGDVFVEV